MRNFRRRGHRRSNPNIGGFSTNELLKLAAGAAVGVAGGKYLTQMLLGSANTGAMGYAGMTAVVLALGWAGNKFAGKDVATGIVAGGLGTVALRIYQEQIAGSASSMSGLGDLQALADMGDYRGGTLPMPAQFAAPIVVAPAPQSRGKRT
jgi:hypothetical protein